VHHDGGIAPPFLTSALDGSEWCSSRPSRFAQGKSPRSPFHRRLRKPHNRSALCAVK
jgi:hypothetical protein